MSADQLQHTPLGKNSDYPKNYDPAQLCPLKRSGSWHDFGYESAPWVGVDIWNAWEISWLNPNGLPQVAVAEIRVPASSPFLIESKSLKLYLNSFSSTSFNSPGEIQDVISTDLSACAKEQVSVELSAVSDIPATQTKLDGFCIDDLDININEYKRNAGLLAVMDASESQQTLYSHLLKTNCPVTGQPDWGTVIVEYRGQTINHEGLLKYIVSLRDECDFHEQCTETIFLDIMQQCQPKELTVYTRYLRRGGLDINPWRSNFEETPNNTRLGRQ